MEKHRVIECKWVKNELIKTIKYFDEPVYQFIKKNNKFKPYESNYGNIWYEDYPEEIIIHYKWYEFHSLMVFLHNLRNNFKKRYTTEHSIIQYIRDVSIVVIGGLLLWWLIEIIKKWIEQYPK